MSPKLVQHARFDRRARAKNGKSDAPRVKHGKALLEAGYRGVRHSTRAELYLRYLDEFADFYRLQISFGGFVRQNVENARGVKESFENSRRATHSKTGLRGIFHRNGFAL
jgi:hypothetical protein